MKLCEFAFDQDDRGDQQGPDYIEQLANRWWNAADPKVQDRIAAVLRTVGYAISQVESEDDAVQLTDIKSGDTYFISADEFDPDVHEQQLKELSFLGSECTKDCSGHRAGYNWSKARGGAHANSPYSPSFNKGAALAVAGK
jgi:hypothetical protein